MSQGFTSSIVNDPDAIHDDTAGEINAVTEKASPVSADLLLIEDSEASNAKKKIQVGNLPGGSGTDDDAIHDNVAGEIAAVTEKTTPVDADVTLIEDSAASNAKKRLSWANIKATLKTYFDTLYAAVADGVTNGDSHDHSGGDGAQIDHAGLANLTTGDPHGQYLKEKASGGAASEVPEHDHSAAGEGSKTAFEELANAKGDLWVASAADTGARLAVGSNDQVLTADSAEATGVKWSTPASGGLDEIFINPSEMLAVQGSPTLTVVTSIYWQVWTLDSASTETLMLSGLIPAGWSTADVHLLWTNLGAGSGDVHWEFRSGTVGDTETISNLGADITTAVTAPAQNVLKKTTIKAGKSVTAGEVLAIMVSRDGGQGTDTLGNDCGLLGVLMEKAS